MKIVLCLMIFVLNSAFVLAAPATNIYLSYDVSTQLLHVEANHPSDRLERYYIQRVVVTCKDGNSQEFTFSRQSRPDKFVADLEFLAQPGDRCDVVLFASDGGRSQAVLEIPESKIKKE
ncbi:MAG: hypothetical protein HQL15_06195 [Candidatus Omnitrophica bacterium]|nr:hypothetical protein [Candidatus Omnitrophota bacterium]